MCCKLKETKVLIRTVKKKKKKLGRLKSITKVEDIKQDGTGELPGLFEAYYPKQVCKVKLTYSSIFERQ